LKALNEIVDEMKKVASLIMAGRADEAPSRSGRPLWSTQQNRPSELRVALARTEGNKALREQRRRENLMRKVIADAFVTLDGFMAGPQGEIDWNEPYFDEEMARYVGEEFATVGTILFGRGTYQLFVQYWPNQGVNFDRKLSSFRELPCRSEVLLLHEFPRNWLEKPKEENYPGQDHGLKINSFPSKRSCVAAAPPGTEPESIWPCSLSLR
jgi:hypothetical protein